MGGVKIFARGSLPAEFRDRLEAHLGRPRPRVLAWARTATGAVVALPDRLVVLDADAATELGWHDVLSGGWDDAGQTMRWVQMSTGDQTELPLVEPGSFPEVFKERVEATFLVQQVVQPTPGRTVTLSARRNLGDEGERVLWTAHPARGVRMEGETLAATEAELARLRAEYAF